MTVEKEPKYTIKLITPTGGSENNIKEILQALEKLTVITESVFSSLRSSIQHQRAHLNSIADRAVAASNVINTLHSSNGLKIVSSNKYPCEEEANTFPKNVFMPPLLTIQPSMLQQVEENFVNKYFPNSPNMDVTSLPDELISFFHSSRNHHKDVSSVLSMKNVLGKPPSQLDNVDSFYLFNTSENAYQNQYSHYAGRPCSTHLSEVRNPKSTYSDETNTTTTNSIDNMDPVTKEESFYYCPTAAQIPTIDVPEFLPNLPGVADALDVLGFDDFDITKPTSLFSSTPLPSSSSTVQPPITDADETPVSPQPSHLASTSKSQKEEPIVSVKDNTNDSRVPSSLSSAPPPPPPPMPPSDLVESEKLTEKKDNPGSDPMDVRSELMAAIRAAGKGKLKSAKDRKVKPPKAPVVNPGSSGSVDMMADLKSTLAMRRRGISGLIDGPKQAGSGDIVTALMNSIPKFEDSTEDDQVKGSDDDDWLSS